MGWGKSCHKYGATKIQHHAGISFASKLEAAIYDMLRLRGLAGEIKDLQCQDHVYLTDARILYIADFAWTELSTMRRVWGEAKGFQTTDWKIKRRLWEFYGPGPLMVWVGSYKHFKLDPKLSIIK